MGFSFWVAEITCFIMKGCVIMDNNMMYSFRFVNHSTRANMKAYVDLKTDPSVTAKYGVVKMEQDFHMVTVYFKKKVWLDEFIMNYHIKVS